MRPRISNPLQERSPVNQAMWLTSLGFLEDFHQGGRASLMTFAEILFHILRADVLHGDSIVH